MTLDYRKIVIFDLDGTLADCQHRIHHINPPKYLHGNGEQQHPKKDWQAFFAACGDDKPIEAVIDMLEAINFANVFQVWIVSGRSDECREQTEAWLAKYLTHYDNLIMRKAGDYTGDDILKVSWLDDGTIPADQVHCVFDDRDRVVNSWRKRGIPCFQVAPGDF